MLASDIRKRVCSEFAEADVFVVVQALETYSGNEPDRVMRCILHLAAGDKDKLAHYVKAARADYRDVIYWAEYDHLGRQVGDFSSPFK